MQHTRELGASNFLDIVAGNGLVLIDWWAPECMPCHSFGPIYERVAGDHPGVTFARVDTQREPELAASFGVRSVPTLMLFRDGILLFSHTGFLAEDALRDLVYQALAMDMDQLRRAIFSEEDPLEMN
jgi:thioredoxin 1